MMLSVINGDALEVVTVEDVMVASFLGIDVFQYIPPSFLVSQDYKYFQSRLKFKRNQKQKTNEARQKRAFVVVAAKCAVTFSGFIAVWK